MNTNPKRRLRLTGAFLSLALVSMLLVTPPAVTLPM